MREQPKIRKGKSQLPLGLAFSALKGAHGWLGDCLDRNDLTAILRGRSLLSSAVQVFLESKQTACLDSIPFRTYAELGALLVTDSNTMLEIAAFRLSSAMRCV
jgi:hypothetical protein